MVSDGYSYILDRQTDEKSYWRCENHKIFNSHYHMHACNSATNTTHVDIINRNETHTANCNRDPIELISRKFYENLVGRVNSTQKSIDNVLSQCLTQLSDTSFKNLNIHCAVVKIQ